MKSVGRADRTTARRKALLQLFARPLWTTLLICLSAHFLLQPARSESVSTAVLQETDVSQRYTSKPIEELAELRAVDHRPSQTVHTIAVAGNVEYQDTYGVSDGSALFDTEVGVPGAINVIPLRPVSTWTICVI